MISKFLAGASLLCTLLAACDGGGSSTSDTTSPPPLPPGWTQLANLPAGVAKFGLAASGGKLYVVGGYDTRRSVLVYDIAADRWNTGPNLPAGSDNVSVLEAGGKVYAMGGEARTAVQVLDTATGTWSAGPVLPAIRFAAAQAALPGSLHLMGGWNYSNTASASLSRHDRFDLASQTWGTAAPLTTARNAAGAAVLSGQIHVVGGRSPGIRSNDQTSLASMEVYTPNTDSWAAGTALPTARAGLAVVALAGRLYALGGESTPGGVSDAVERYDPVTRTWSVLTAMPYRSHGLGAVVVGDAIYVMGGFTGSSDAVGSESVALYRYQPAN